MGDDYTYDANGNNLTVTDEEGYVVTYTYDANPNAVTSNQTDTFIYTVQDGDGDLSTTTLTINVNNVSVTASDSEALVNEAGLPSGSDSGASSEAFNGAITPAGGTGPYTYTLTSNGNGTYGNLVLNADGTYTYTLDTTYDGATNNNGVTTEPNVEGFNYTVTDANGNTTTGTINVAADTADLAHCCAGLYCRACAVERGYAAINVQRRLAQPGRW